MGQSHPRRYHVAVIGYYGSGKTSFINSMEGMLPAMDIKRIEVDGDQAKVIAEKRKNNYHYRSQDDRDQMLFWEFSAEKMYKSDCIYALEYTIFKTDPVCFLYKSRLTEDDMRLLTYLHKLCQNVLIIRTGIDKDVCNYKKSHQQTHKQKDILSIMQKYMLWHKRILEQSGRSGHKIETFFISNDKRSPYDLKELTDTLVISCRNSGDSSNRESRLLRCEIDSVLHQFTSANRESGDWYVFRQQYGMQVVSLSPVILISIDRTVTYDILASTLKPN